MEERLRLELPLFHPLDAGMPEAAYLEPIVRKNGRVVGQRLLRVKQTEDGPIVEVVAEGPCPAPPRPIRPSIAAVKDTPAYRHAEAERKRRARAKKKRQRERVGNPRRSKHGGWGPHGHSDSRKDDESNITHRERE